MKFTSIQQELDAKLLACEIVKRNLRKHCSFSVEMQYRLIINFIGMGCYGNIEAMLQNLMYHPETTQIDMEEIMRSVKEVLQLAVKLDTLHRQDAFHQLKSTALINEEETIFAAKIGRWLET